MAKIALKIGGSVLVPDEIDMEFLQQISNLLKDVSEENSVYVVVGGGRIARNYITACRLLGADEGFLDETGIAASRLNARLLIGTLGDRAYRVPPRDFHEAHLAGHRHSVVVMGGTHPGHTTDAVCALLAERVNVERLIISTDVEGIYTDDPKRNENAKLLKKVRSEELLEICQGAMGMAGVKCAVDPLAAKIIARSNIPTAVVKGTEIENLKRALKGKSYEGTEIEPR